MNNLPPLNSERKQFQDRLTQLQEEKSLISGIILRRVTRIVNTAEFLSEEAKDELLKLIWEK